VNRVPLADCRPYPRAPERERRVFGTGRRGERAGRKVVQAGPRAGPAVRLGGQAAAKGVVAA